MSRYFYYPVLLVMSINTILYVPKMLLEQRFDGGIPALIIGICLSTLLTFLFTNGMSKFPGLTLPEILERTAPSSIRVPILLVFGIMWAISGSFVLVAFSIITNQVLSPDISRTLLLAGSIAIICWSSTRPFHAVVNVLEISMLLSLPLLGFIVYKALTDSLMDWDAVMSMTDYVFQIPSWDSLATASYIFAGYVNLAIFNRIYKNTKIKYLWSIPILGIVFGFISIIVPIGFHGTESVADYTYTWVSTADSITMPLGFIERLMYIFMFVYIGLSLLFTTVGWNVGLALIRPCFKKLLGGQQKKITIFNWIVGGVFGLSTYVFGLIINEKELIFTTLQWLRIRFAAEIALVALVFILGRRKKNA